MGEPLLHPQLPELLEICRALDFRVTLTTNGTLLPARQPVLLAAPALRKVSVSLHSFEANEAGDFRAYLTGCTDFARAAMLDLDTFTQRPLDDLWRECDEAVLLYQVPHAASQTMTAAISRCFDAVEPDGAPHALTHFGGELVAGSRARLANFMSLCRDYFEELQAKGITPREGDEAVWCGAAYRSLLAGKPVRAANAYIFRYWLGGHFYYVSTNYTLDPVCILHLPGAAKDRQLKLIYNDYARRGVFPPLKKIYRLCGLPAAHPPLLRTVWTRLLAKL